MTSNNSILRKLFYGSMMLVAMFALAGSALFFTDTASAARGEGTPQTAEDLEQAVADGEITQEQADRIAERQEARAERQALTEQVFDQDVIDQVVAAEIGISVDELLAAKEDGVGIRELAEENGVDPQDVRDAVAAAKDGMIQDALDAGEISEEEAEMLQEGGRRGSRGEGNGEDNGGRRPGRGNGGGNGGQPPVDGEA